MRKSLDPGMLPPAIDGLIIKHGSVTAARYATRVEAQARKRSKQLVEAAEQKKQTLLDDAKAEGYLFGLDFFIQHMITTIDGYQRAFESIVALAKSTLIGQLEQSFTSETLLRPLLKEFSEHYVNEKQVHLFLPQKLEKTVSEEIKDLSKNIQVTWTDETIISVEIGSEILTFNAENYSKNLYRAADNIVYRSKRYKQFSAMKDNALQFARELLQDKSAQLAAVPSIQNPENHQE